MSHLPLAARLNALRSLTAAAQGATTLGLNAVRMTTDGLFTVSVPPRPSNLRFIADEMPFQVAVNPDGDGAVCQMWAEVGIIPFSATDPARRRQLLDLLRGMNKMTYARFVVQEGQKILLVSEERTDGHVTPEDLAWQLAETLREARPFLALLAEHL